jgi:hypothetical protein
MKMKKKGGKGPMHRMPDGTMMPGKTHGAKKPAKKSAKKKYSY